MHPFDADTRVRPAGDGHFTATATERWHTVGSRAFGGYGLAMCLHALRSELAQPDPLALSAFFIRPLRAGSAELTTGVVHSGRRTAVGEVSLSQQRRTVLHVVATFGRLSTAGIRRYGPGPPELPAPESCLDLYGDAAASGLPVTDRVECRAPELPGWRMGRPSGVGEAEFWIRFREPRDPDVFALPLLADAAAPVIFELGETESTTLQLTAYMRAHPAPGWLICRSVTRILAGGYHDEDLEMWDTAGTLVLQSRQLAVTATPRPGKVARRV